MLHATQVKPFDNRLEAVHELDVLTLQSFLLDGLRVAREIHNEAS